MDGLPSDLSEHFRIMVDLLGKIEKWWIISFYEDTRQRGIRW